MFNIRILGIGMTTCLTFSLIYYKTNKKIWNDMSSNDVKLEEII